ncbi:MAG: FliH/SctL family protein [Phycisphaerae bacterium]
MPLVKAHHQSLPARQSGIVMDLADLEQQAAQMLEKAQRQAQEILAAARADAQREGQEIRDQARKTGHQEGYEAGFQEGQAKGHDVAVTQAGEGFNALVARWSATLEKLQANLPMHLADVRVDLVKLALAIAAKVTRQEALRNSAVMQANVQESLALVTAGRSVVVQIHPDEFAVLEGYLPQLVERFRSINGIELKADPAIEPGGCVLAFGSGEIDARLETQIQRIADELVGPST